MQRLAIDGGRPVRDRMLLFGAPCFGNEEIAEVVDTIKSGWVGTGPNKEISPNDLSKALGEDRIKTLMAHSGLSREELIAGLSQQLPELINQLTPNGRIPTEQEASRLI